MFLASKSLGICKFPAVAIKTKLQDKFQTVLCYEGFIDSTMLLGLIQSVLLACESEIAQAAEISAMRALQSDQNAAYLKSLEADKEKLRKLRADKDVDAKESNNEISSRKDITGTVNVIDAANLSESADSSNLNDRICKAFLDLEDEPKDGNVFKFQFLFPDGTRQIRKFSSEATTKVKGKM